MKKFKFDIKEYRNSFIEWFIIASFSGIDDKEREKIVSIQEEKRKNDDNSFEVTMQINGISVNPKTAISGLQEQFNRMVNEKAKEIVDNIISDKFDIIDENINDVNSLVSSFKERLIKSTGLEE